jgi:WD40 repeat protein
LAWSPDGQFLACGTSRRGVMVWETRGDKITPRWASNAFPTFIRTVAWSPDGARLAGGGDDGALYVWDCADGALLQSLTGHHGMITCLAWETSNLGGALGASGASRRLVSASRGVEGGELFVWDVERGERSHALTGLAENVYSVVWGPSEQLVVSGDSDGMLRWRDLQRGENVQVRPAHQGIVQSLRRSPDGTKLVSCGDDGALMTWDFFSGDPMQTLRRDRPYERMEISGLSGITEAQRASLMALGAIEHTGSSGMTP